MPTAPYSDAQRKRGERLGEAVQAAREAAGWSQRVLAKKAKLDLDTVRGIEQGRRASPGVFNIAALARALNASVDEWIKQARARR